MLPSYPLGHRSFWLLFVLGTFLRLLVFFLPKALWLDEAMLAQGVLPQGWHSWGDPLPYYQSAPVGYVAWLRLLTVWLGQAEWVLRLPSLISSIVSLPLCYAAVITWRGPRVARVVLLLTAVNWPLIYYGTEAKPYALDALLTTALFCLLFYQLERRWHRGWLLLGGILAPWFSFPVVFVLLGIGFFLLLRTRWAVAELKWWVFTMSVWMGSAVLHLLLVPRSPEGMAFMAHYWAYHQLAWPLKSGGMISWLASHLWYALRDFSGIEGGGALIWLILLSSGLFFSLRYRSLGFLALGLLPLTAQLTLTALGVYALYERLLTYLLPWVLWLAAEGWVAGIGWLGLTLRNSLSTAALCSLLCLPVFFGLPHVARFNLLLPSQLRWLSERWELGQAIYVYGGGSPMVRYYADLLPEGAELTHGAFYFEWWSGDRTPSGLAARDSANWQHLYSELNQLQGPTWIVIHHSVDTRLDGFQEEFDLILAWIEAQGYPIQQECRSGLSGVFLIDARPAIKLPNEY
jgi:hypothetical protein